MTEALLWAVLAGVSILILLTLLGFFFKGDSFSQKIKEEWLLLLRQESRGSRDELQQSLFVSRKELSEGMARIEKVLQDRLDVLLRYSSDSAQKQTRELQELKTAIAEAVIRGLKEIQEKNDAKLEQIRLTVDEKLQKTLNQRLTESFELVTRQLLQVQKGLTEMQSLAQDVGGLKRVLSNIKVRGMMGEAQLGALLEQFLTPQQYETNAVIVPRSSERVEFAVKMPGAEDGEDSVWLPIDSKFPMEDYQRMQEAFDTGDKPSMEAAASAFEKRLHDHAKEIATKYIKPPHSTDFALMFLPFESLFAEAIRRPGVFQGIQSRYKVTIVGPTTLAAFLNSLQVGFKTLVLSRRSREVWKVLGAVKTEFSNFGEVLSRVQKNLEHATSGLTKVSHRARQMERKLGVVTGEGIAENDQPALGDQESEEG